MKHSSVFEVGDTVTTKCKLCKLVEEGARGTVRAVAPYTTQVLVDFGVWVRWVRVDFLRHTLAVEADNG